MTSLNLRGDLIRKDTSCLMRVLSRVLWIFGVRRFMTDFWTTIRLPFGRPTIYYPTTVSNPFDLRHSAVLAHEAVHARQQLGFFGLWSSILLYLVFPLPVLFSGRWWLEREAYLVSIRRGGWSVDEVVEVLWGSYFYPWPRAWMRAWFKRRLQEP